MDIKTKVAVKAAEQGKGGVDMLADLLMAAYPDTDGQDRCPYCGSEAVFNGVRLRLSQIGHDWPCRWLEARENVAAARRSHSEDRKQRDQKVGELLTFLHEWFLNGGRAIHSSTLVNDQGDTFEDLVRKCTFGWM